MGERQHKSLASELREIMVSIGFNLFSGTGSSHNIRRKPDWVNKFPAKETLLVALGFYIVNLDFMNVSKIWNHICFFFPMFEVFEILQTVRVLMKLQECVKSNHYFNAPC